jgi:beta-lactamase regulating signal transducer with metallopeptidase domain
MTISTLIANIDVWGAFLLQVTLKITTLLVVLLVVDRLCSRKYAAWRNLLWKVGLVGVLLVPLAAAMLPALSVPVPVENEWKPVVEPFMDATQTSIPLNAAAEIKPAPPPAPPADLEPAVSSPPNLAQPLSWTALVLALYGVGLLALGGYLLANFVHAARLKRNTLPIKDGRWQVELQRLCAVLGLRRRVQLAGSARVDVPTQVGILKPMILLPVYMLADQEERTMRSVIAHELTHVQRLDFLFNLLAAVALALYWFNPLAWLAARRLQETGEQTCDDWVVGITGHHQTYAHTLLDVVEHLKRKQRFALSVGMARKPQIAERIERIATLAGNVSPRIGRLAGVVAVCGFVICVCLLATSTLHAAPQQLKPAVLKIELNPEFSAQMEELIIEARQKLKEGHERVSRDLEEMKKKGVEESRLSQVQEHLDDMEKQVESLTGWTDEWNRERDWRAVDWEKRWKYSERFMMFATRAFNKRYSDLGIYLCQRGLEAHPENHTLWNSKWHLLFPAKATADSIPGEQVVRWIAGDLETIMQQDLKPQGKQSLKIYAYKMMYRWTGAPTHLNLMREAVEHYVATYNEGDPLFQLARMETEPAKKAALLKRYLELEPDSSILPRVYTDLIHIEADAPGILDQNQIEKTFTSLLTAIENSPFRDNSLQLAEFYMLRAEFAVDHDRNTAQAHKWLREFDELRKGRLEETNQRILKLNPIDSWRPLLNLDASKQVVLGDAERLQGNEEAALTHYHKALDVVGASSVKNWSTANELWIADGFKNLRRRLIARLDGLGAEERF